MSSKTLKFLCSSRLFAVVILLPPASEGWRKVLFSQVCVCQQGVGEGCLSFWSLVPSQPLVPCTLLGGGLPLLTGPRSFPGGGGTRVLVLAGRRGYPCSGPGQGKGVPLS